jgi:GxxExxY protein
MTNTERHALVMDAATTVHATLGGHCPVEFLEAAMVAELGLRGVEVLDRNTMHVCLGATSTGAYLADIVIDGNTLIEIKRTATLTDGEKSGFARFVEEIRYQRGYLMNFAGDLEVVQYPAPPRQGEASRN